MAAEATESYSTSIPLYVTEKTKRNTKILAARQGRSMSELAREAFLIGLERLEAQQQLEEAEEARREHALEETG